MYTAIISTDGIMTVAAQRANRALELFEIQAAVGGYVEEVSAALPDGTTCVLLLDEDGKLKGRSVNTAATTVAQMLGMIRRSDCIVGDAMLCAAGDGGLYPLDEQAMNSFMTLFTMAACAA